LSLPLSLCISKRCVWERGEDKCFKRDVIFGLDGRRRMSPYRTQLPWPCLAWSLRPERRNNTRLGGIMTGRAAMMGREQIYLAHNVILGSGTNQPKRWERSPDERPCILYEKAYNPTNKESSYPIDFLFLQWCLISYCFGSVMTLEWIPWQLRHTRTIKVVGLAHQVGQGARWWSRAPYIGLK
jgi:hypothetical protein